MGETVTPDIGDDAPLSESKRSERQEAAAATIAQPVGDTLVAKTVTIGKPRQELYDYWRTLERLPTFMDNVVSVEPIGGDRYRWVVKAPAGKTVEWIAAVTEDVPGQTVGWASEEGADVPNSGRVEFREAPGGRGTWVTATILYDPPGGAVGRIIAKLFQREPAIQARRDLRRFKQLMETGEIATGARNLRDYAEETD